MSEMPRSDGRPEKGGLSLRANFCPEQLQQNVLSIILLCSPIDSRCVSHGGQYYGGFNARVAI
jgi:hypothetical protein